MRGVIESLCDVLRSQLESQESLLALSLEKRGVIVSGDTARLDEIIKLELREMTKMGKAEKKRLALLSALSKELNIPEDAPLSAIIDAAEVDERPALKQLQKDLTGAYGLLDDLNAANKRLIENQLEYTEAMLSVYVSGENPLNNLYGEDGQIVDSEAKPPGFFDGTA